MRTYPKSASQSGFALPTVLFALIGMMAVLSVGAVAAINTQRGTVRDANSKSALAIAESGANIALLRYNRAVTDTTFGLDRASDACVLVNNATGQPEPAPRRAVDGVPDDWCEGEEGMVGEGRFTYWVKPPEPEDVSDSWKIEIVAQGQLIEPDGQIDLSTTRVIRLEADARQLPPPSLPSEDPPDDESDDEGGDGGDGDPGENDPPPEDEEEEPDPEDPDPTDPPPGAYLGAENIVGIDWLAVDGNSPIYSNAGSNGQVFIKDSARICGAVRMGPGTPSPVGPHLAHWMPLPAANYSNGQGGGICYPPEYPVGYGTRDFQPVVLPEGLTPANSATNRFFAEDGNDLPPWYIGTQQQRNQRWNPVTRTLTIDAGLTLRLKATYPYFLCRLVLAGGATIVADAPGQPVQIFFDKPENCPHLPNTSQYRAWYLPQPHWQQGSKQQLEIANGTQFLSNGHVPGLFFLGSDTIPTGIVMAGGSATHQMVVYAPKTEIDISGDFKFNGAMIGKTLHMGGGSRINAPFDGTTYPIPVEPPPPPDPDPTDPEGPPDPPDDPDPSDPDPDPTDPQDPPDPSDPTGPTGETGPTGYTGLGFTSFSRLKYSECKAQPVIDPSALSCG